MGRVIDYLGNHNGVAALVLFVLAFIVAMLLGVGEPGPQRAPVTTDPGMVEFCRDVPVEDSGAREDCAAEWARRNQ